MTTHSKILEHATAHYLRNQGNVLILTKIKLSPKKANWELLNWEIKQIYVGNSSSKVKSTYYSKLLSNSLAYFSKISKY